MTESEAGPQERARMLLADEGPDAVLSEPWALAALADPGQWAGDVERALAALPNKKAAAVRRAGRQVLRAGREEAGEVVRFPGSPPPVSVPKLAQPMILSARGGCWVWVEGGYAPVSEQVAVSELLRYGSLLTVDTANGTRACTFAEAYQRVGARVSRVVYELGAERDMYDPVDTTLYLACGRSAAVTPTFHRDVADWLEALVTTERAHGRLLDWLCSAWDLRHPTAALYLEGAGSTGKSMLAQGLQRCWGTGITTYADVVLGSYSAGIIRQPIVWLDERAPEDHHGRGTAAFRSLIGNRSHPYTEKYQPSGTIVGCPRLIVTSNTDDALRFGREDLVRADLEAIAIRILHLDVDSRAAEYLAKIDTTGWVETEDGKPGKICEHLAWLRDNHVITRLGKRFLVEGEVGAWLRRQSTQSGLAQDVLVALVRALTDLRDAEDPVTRERPAQHLVTPERGHVLVGATELHRAWPLLTGDRSGRVTVARLGRVLRGLAGHTASNGVQRRHAIANDLLLDACTSIHGSGSMLHGVLL